MTNEEARYILKSLKDYYNDKNEDSYVGFDDEDNTAVDKAIKALESPNICWIVGENGEQFAFKNMPIDKAEKILAIVNGEIEGMRDATEQERKSVTLQINKMSKHVSDFSDFWGEIKNDE